MRRVHSPASSAASSRSSRRADLERVLAVDVAQPGRQLDEPAPGRVAVLPQAQHPLLVVHRQHDHRAGVLEHQPRERLLLRVAGAPDAVRPQRHHPVVAVQVGARVATGQASGSSAQRSRASACP